MSDSETDSKGDSDGDCEEVGDDDDDRKDNDDNASEVDELVEVGLTNISILAALRRLQARRSFSNRPQRI